MVIPDETFWAAATVMGAIMGWLITLERRLNARLTREEHSVICDKANVVLTAQLDKITLMLDRQNESTLQHRQWMGDSIATIRTQVAVIQDRLKLGAPPP